MSVPLSIVIPVHHEAENIAPTLSAIEQHVPPPYEVLVCYDDDADPTLAALAPLTASRPHWRAVKNTVHRGPSGALRAGFRAAHGARVLVAMADLCDDWSQVPALLALDADLVAPSRYMPGGRQELTGLKAWTPRLVGHLLGLITGLPTCDPTNSFKLYPGNLLREIRLTSTVSFSVTLEIVAKAYCLGYRIREVPTVWRDRAHGQSNFPFWRSLPAYLPWFGVTLLGAPWMPVPRAWCRRWFSA